MPLRPKLILTLVVCAVLAHASSVYNSSASFSGVRSVGGSGGLIDGGGHGYDDLLLSWSIVSLPEWGYQYTYVLQYREAPFVGQVVVDLSNECAVPVNAGNPSPSCISQEVVNGFPAQAAMGNWCVSGCQPGNPSPRANIGGVQLTQLPHSYTSLTISFTAPGAPVWGDFYIAGGFQYVLNGGVLNPLSTNLQNFVAVPGAIAAPAPEPPTLGLAGVALILLATMRRRRS